VARRKKETKAQLFSREEVAAWIHDLAPHDTIRMIKEAADLADKDFDWLNGMGARTFIEAVQDIIKVERVEVTVAHVQLVLIAQHLARMTFDAMLDELERRKTS
jgi:hypothetical protein